MYKVRKVSPDNPREWQEISSCNAHIARTMMELGVGIEAIITEVDDIMHTCMGCHKGWLIGTLAR